MLRIAPTYLQWEVEDGVDDYRKKYAHLKESGGIGCDQQPIPSFPNNAIHNYLLRNYVFRPGSV